MPEPLPLTEPDASTLHTTDTFRVRDVEQILAWLAAYPLVSIVTADANGLPRVSPAPLLIRRDDGSTRLFSHLDRRNPQLVHLETGKPFLVVAQGPRAYASPAWFKRRPAAPSYLHVTVHVHASAEILNDDAASDVLLDTVEQFERDRDRWSYDGGERYLRAMSGGISAFELHVIGVEAAGKINQNRSREERIAIATHLEQSSSSDAREIAAMIRASAEAQP